MALAEYAKVAKNMGLSWVALQETRRDGDVMEDFLFSGELLRGWRFVGSGSQNNRVGGVGFLLTPHVTLAETHRHSQAAFGRVMSIRIHVHGLRLRVTNVYAPHNEHSQNSKDQFYRTLETCLTDMDTFKKFKSVVLGDFNAIVGSDAAHRLGSSCGTNNSNVRDTNDNGLRFLQFCRHRGLLALNTHFRPKRRHRGTHFLQTQKNWRRLDYICTTKFLKQFAVKCRAVTELSITPGKLTHDNYTDHNPVICHLSIPPKHQIRAPRRKRRKPQPRYDLGGLRFGTDLAEQYSKNLTIQLRDLLASKDVNVENSQLIQAISNAMADTLPKLSRRKQLLP